MCHQGRRGLGGCPQGAAAHLVPTLPWQLSALMAPTLPPGPPTLIGHPLLPALCSTRRGLWATAGRGKTATSSPCTPIPPNSLLSTGGTLSPEPTGAETPRSPLANTGRVSAGTERFLRAGRCCTCVIHIISFKPPSMPLSSHHALRTRGTGLERRGGFAKTEAGSGGAGTRPRAPCSKATRGLSGRGSESRSPRSQGGTREHGPTCRSWSGD